MEISEIQSQLETLNIKIELLNISIVQISCALTTKKEELNKRLKQHKILDMKLALMDGRFKLIKSKSMRNTIRRTQASMDEDILKDFKNMNDSERQAFLRRLHAWHKSITSI